MKTRTNDILFIIAIIFALWFVAVGWVWVYYVNIIYAMPFGIAALLIWFKLKKAARKETKSFRLYLLPDCFFRWVGFCIWYG